MKTTKMLLILLLIILEGCSPKDGINTGTAVYTIGLKYKLTDRVFINDEAIYYLDDGKMYRTDESFKANEMIKDGVDGCYFYLEKESVLLMLE